LTTDQRSEGFVRVFDIPNVGNNASPFIVDMGAYEFGVLKVIDVTVSGSVSLHAEYSFAEQNAVGSGKQLKTIPVGGADTVELTFSEEIDTSTFSGTSLGVIGLTTGNEPQLVNSQSTSSQAQWQFINWQTFGDNYLISLTDGVLDRYGQNLDGEWINPADVDATNSSGNISSFPSGDGSVSGKFDFVLTLLPGDANLDGEVGSDDFSILASNFGNTLDQFFADADFDGDGEVGGSDFTALALNFGKVLQVLGVAADLDGDGEVTQAERDVVFNNQGITSGATLADGDVDGDGDVDQDDLDIANKQWLFGIDIDWAQ